MSVYRQTSAWAGWVVFAACMLMVLGTLNVFQGIAAVADEGYFRTPSGDLLVWDFTAWGVILMCFGGVQFLIGLGLFNASALARWCAVAVTMLNIIAQIGFLDARPVWTSIVIALDVVVLYALTARWAVATAPEEYMETRAGAAEWQADQAATRADAEGRRTPPPGGGQPS